MPKDGRGITMGVRTKRDIAASIAAILESDDRATARHHAECERAGIGTLDTAARAVLRNRRRCGPMPGPELAQGAARP